MYIADLTQNLLVSKGYIVEGNPTNIKQKQLYLGERFAIISLQEWGRIDYGKDSNKYLFSNKLLMATSITQDLHELDTKFSMHRIKLPFDPIIYKNITVGFKESFVRIHYDFNPSFDLIDMIRGQGYNRKSKTIYFDQIKK